MLLDASTASASSLPDSLSLVYEALRRIEVRLTEFEGAIGRKSLNQVFREDRAVNRMEGRILAAKMLRLDKNYRDWLGLNGRTIRAAVRQKFMEHVNISSLPAAQLEPEQKAFKKIYSAGRRDLEHEFGKTMRYKSIRDLAAGDTGRVIHDLFLRRQLIPLTLVALHSVGGIDGVKQRVKAFKPLGEHGLHAWTIQLKLRYSDFSTIRQAAY